MGSYISYFSDMKYAYDEEPDIPLATTIALDFIDRDEISNLRDLLLEGLTEKESYIIAGYCVRAEKIVSLVAVLNAGVVSRDKVEEYCRMNGKSHLITEIDARIAEYSA